MKDLDQSPEQINQEIVIPVKTTKQITPPKRLPKGLTQWEVDLKTHIAKPVEFKQSEISKDSNGITQIKHHIEYRKDKYYCMALNLNNCMKKYRKWFIANQNAMSIMAAMRPTPESPSAAASQSE